MHPSTIETPISRRKLIGTAAAAGITLGTIHWNRQEGLANELKNELPNNGVVLFQGDSITDAGRNKNAKQANRIDALGRGYAMLAASSLLANHPTLNLKCYNRGISGNKVPDLDQRWQQDCIDLRPNVLSILIGVNDIWHKLNGNYKGTVKDYETGLQALLERTRSALPETRIVICEPFVLRCGAVSDKWFPEFDERREACRKVSDALQCTWVPFQQMFDEAVENTEPAYWGGDGVHPSVAGHALMAKTWLETVNASS